MNQEDYERLEREFMGIRDERGVHANTAVRIGTAFLDLLRITRSGNFDEISFNKVINKPEFLQGLIALGTIVLGEYVSGMKGGLLSPDGAAELKNLWVREYAKVGDGSQHYDDMLRALPALEVLGDAVISDNLSSPNFISDFFGGLGWAIQKKEVVNAAGVVEYKYHLEIDDITVRNTLRVFEMIVSQLLGENANRFFSDMMEVDHYDPVTHRVMLDTKNGKLYNSLRPGDIVMVQQFNGSPTAENDWYVTKAYEFRVTAVGVGNLEDGENRLDWLEFDNFVSSVEGLTPEKAFKKGDTFVRADNDRNPNRKGLVTIMAVGENTPYMEILYGLKTDPKHALKGRIGNLEGIRTDLFGWLEGFGAYINNLYGVGKFFNAQTGESMQARQEVTLQRFHSMYAETVFNITEEENFLANGFFQKNLDSWQRCETDGTAVADEPDNMLLGVVDTAGESMSPILLNGDMITVSNRRIADITDLDGIKVLHLLGMGVSQSFSNIKVRGSHKEMESSNQSSTNIVDVVDDMYMGIRILPVTSGMLSVRFIKADGSWTGWQQQLNESFDWVLRQVQDLAGDRWEWSGSGKMVVSFTGECYIRFVTLTTDAVANARLDYATHIEQTSRRITLQAARTDAQHQTAMAEIQIQHDAVMNVVTTNKSVSDTMLATILGITVNADGTYNIPDALKGENMATWRINTNQSINDIAAHWDANDRLIGYSTSQQTADAIASAVYGLAKSSEVTALDATLREKINSDIAAVNESISAVDTENDNRANVLATWQQQTSEKITAIAGKWDSSGNLIGYSTSQQTADAIASAVYGLAKSSEVTALDATLREKINSDIAAVNESISAVDTENDNRANVLATWQQQTSAEITAIAGKWDSSGNLIGYSTSQQTADAISNAVASLATKSSVDAIQSSLNTLENVTVPGLVDDISSAYNLANNAKTTADAAYAYGTLINQNSDNIAVLSNRFNSDGSLKNTSGLVTGNGDFATLFSAALRNDGTVMKKSEMGTYVQKDGDGYITGAYVKADRVDFTAQLVQVYNDSGDITFQLDRDGNLKVKGEISGGQIIQNIKVGTTGSKMEIYCDERSSGGFSKHSGIRGLDDNGDKILDLGFIEYGANKLMASLNIGKSFYREGEFCICSRGYKLDVGFARDKIHITAPWDAWPVTNDPGSYGVAKGTVYVDEDGFLKVMNV